MGPKSKAKSALSLACDAPRLKRTRFDQEQYDTTDRLSYLKSLSKEIRSMPPNLFQVASRKQIHAVAPGQVYEPPQPELLLALGTKSEDAYVQAKEKWRQQTLKQENGLLKLNAEQRQIYDQVVLEQKSLFITGGAGRGKTFLLLLIVEGLRLQTREVQVVAMTGIAAKAVQGTTFHHLFGLPVEDQFQMSSQAFLTILLRNKRLVNQLRQTHCFVIDEISMMSPTMFETLNLILCTIMLTKTVFGGKQIVACGDFLQLPPVEKSFKGKQTESKYCFESLLWSKLFPLAEGTSKELLQNFRQDDPTFVKVLDAFRVGQTAPDLMQILLRNAHQTKEEIKIINKKEKEVLSHDYKDLTKDPPTFVPLYDLMAFGKITLFPRRKQVREHNLRRERILQISRFPDDSTKNFNITIQFTQWSAKDRLKQKKNKQRLDDVNNNQAYLSPDQYMRYWIEHQRLQVSKSKAEQRMITRLLCDESDEIRSNVDEDLRQLKQLKLQQGSRIMLTNNLSLTKGFVHGLCGYVVRFAEDSNNPIVAWDNMNEESEVKPLESHFSCSEGFWTVNRVPLILAWAVTIHKSQSLTLALVDLYLANIFTHGQAYVGLSRVTSLNGLRLLEFNLKDVKAPHPSVLTFYRIRFPSNPLYQPPKIEVSSSLVQYLAAAEARRARFLQRLAPQPPPQQPQKPPQQPPQKPPQPRKAVEQKGERREQGEESEMGAAYDAVYDAQAFPT